MSHIKVSIDQSAKEYWKKLYGEYGEALVRDIPRRIKAALVDNKKVASVDEVASVVPVASARTAEGMMLEGMCDTKGTRLLFRATIDNAGNVTDITSIEIR